MRRAIARIFKLDLVINIAALDRRARPESDAWKHSSSFLSELAPSSSGGALPPGGVKMICPFALTSSIWNGKRRAYRLGGHEAKAVLSRRR